MEPVEQLPQPESISLTNPTKVPSGEAGLLRRLVPLSVRLFASQCEEDAMNVYRQVAARADDKVGV